MERLYIVKVFQPNVISEIYHHALQIYTRIHYPAQLIIHGYQYAICIYCGLQLSHLLSAFRIIASTQSESYV